ncbi:MAG TPA: hypothetical protein VFU42_10025 [Candidatus Deferrimicrobiaceae bacterium]|nr:hypothetical protein [Candidatus Deferrimicrobiaceae bacterium]
MRAILDFLVETRILEIAVDPRVVFAAAALFLFSLFMKWRIVALSIFAAGALLAVARYSQVIEGKAALGGNMLVFILGTLVVSVILIYFLFIRGD